MRRQVEVSPDHFLPKRFQTVRFNYLTPILEYTEDSIVSDMEENKVKAV
jgi:hypothetical protein